MLPSAFNAAAASVLLLPPAYTPLASILLPAPTDNPVVSMVTSFVPALLIIKVSAGLTEVVTLPTESTEEVIFCSTLFPSTARPLLSAPDSVFALSATSVLVANVASASVLLYTSAVLALSANSVLVA